MSGPMPPDVPDVPADASADLLPGLRLSASLVATEARLLPLEMPELLPGMPLEPPGDPDTRLALGNAWESAYNLVTWLRSVMMHLGNRAGRTYEYDLAYQFWANPPIPDRVLPAFRAFTQPVLERCVWEGGAEWDVWRRGVTLADGKDPMGTLHMSAFVDALRTTLALLVVAGELTIDEASGTFRRTYPRIRNVMPQAAARILRRRLRALYGDAITRVWSGPLPGRRREWRRGGNRIGPGVIRVEHDGTIPAEELGDLLRLYERLADAPTRENPDPDQWLNALWPCGRVERLLLFPRRFVPSAPRLRHDQVPAGAVPVFFYVHQASAHVSGSTSPQ